jgi:glyoxylase I family protein
MALPVSGMAHIALRVTDLERAKRFYGDGLGFPQVREAPGVAFFAIGGTVFALIGETHRTPSGDEFDPFRVGLDHLALAVTASDLPALKERLDAAGVRNNGVQHDDRSGADAITFYDPDGIAWEFYASNR